MLYQHNTDTDETVLRYNKIVYRAKKGFYGETIATQSTIWIELYPSAMARSSTNRTSWWWYYGRLVTESNVNYFKFTNTELIDIADVGYTGSYNDLTDKPNIPDVSNYYTKAEVNALASKVTATYESSPSALLSANVITIDGMEYKIVSDSSSDANVKISSNMLSNPGTSMGIAGFNIAAVDGTFYPAIQVFDDPNNGLHTHTCYDGTTLNDYKYWLRLPEKEGTLACLDDIPTVPTNVSAFTNDAGYITGITSSDVTTALGYTPGTSNFSGSYTDLTNKPSIPTVNDNTITITQDGVTKGSFTLNQNTNQTIALDNVPGMIGEVIFSTTPTSGATTYPINLTKNITQYDYVEIYYNANDDIVQRWSAVFPNPKVGDKINITCALNGSIRLYTKNTCFEVATTTSLTLVNSAQQRVGNNEATTYANITNGFHCRPYKIIGYKQNSAPIVTYDNLYRNNDSFAFNSIANLQGYLTSAGKTIQFTVTTPKLLTNVTSITVDNLYAVVRGVGGYVNGSSYIDYANTTGYTVTAYKATDNMITITIDATNAYSSGTNNTPVALAFNPNNNTGLKLTFNE